VVNHRGTLIWLVPLIAVLAAVASVAGLLVQGGPGPSSFTTVHGQTVQLYGLGLYESDTLFYAATFKGLDAVTLGIFIPALLAAWWAWRRGSARAGVALAGGLAVFLYNGASMAFSAAYNPLFLLYVALLGTSFLAFVLAFVGLDHRALAAGASERLPRRGLALFLCLAGLAPLALWLGDVVGSLAAGRVPELLGSYTTAYTYAVDLAIVVPAVYLAAYLLWRRSPVGYALAATMLVLLVSVGVGVVATTIVQTSVGIAFSTGQLIGLIGSWVVLGALAVAFTAALLRALPDAPASASRQSRERAPARQRQRSASAHR
jgi:hypothetical protein